MLRIAATLFVVSALWAQETKPPAPPSKEEYKKLIASYPADDQVYELWRFWVFHQPPEVQKLFDKDGTKAEGFALYRKELERDGDSPAEIDRKIRIIDKDGERWEIERWNRLLTSNSPRVNWKPNAFLMEMVKGRKPGRALDVAMGQGRNALWLAQQGWETTGYDPAEKAVALAKEMAGKAGVKVNAVIAKDSEFDMGTAKWDLIVLSYVEIRDNAERVIRALAPGGIVVAEYFHADPAGSPGGFLDNELLKLFMPLRVIRYEDTEAIADFGMKKTPLVRLCAEKPAH